MNKVYNRYTFTLLMLLMCTVTVFSQRGNDDGSDTLKMDFEDYDPPGTLVVEGEEVTRAKFPFVDVHSHHWRNSEPSYFEKLGKEMDELNMKALINLSGRTGENLKQQVEYGKKYMPGRYIVFCNINIQSINDPDFTESTVAQLENDVKNGASGLKIYKSQGMTNRDSNGKRIPIDDPRLDPVWAKCGELGIPILIHSADPAPFWQKRDKNNERWLELKLRSGRYRYEYEASFEQIIGEQHNIFKKHPNTTFINAHMGWYANDLGKLAELMEEMPNMYVEIGAVIAELGRQPRAANKFFEKYQDRILFGKDSYRPEEYHTYFRVLESDDEYFPYYKRYHAYWRMYGLDLPDHILKKLYYKNALKIIPNMDASLFPE